MLVKLASRLKALPAVGKVGLGVVTLFAVGTVASAVVGPSQINPTTTPKITTANNVKGDQTEVKTITTTEEVPFTSTTVQDSSVAQGKTVVRTAGVNGIKTQIWKVTYTNGTETGRSLESETITTQPVNQVTAIGTAVPKPTCPNGTYTNSVGNIVCSPYSAPSTPSGATAQCRDGSYSFSQSHSGTCSHHGGVASWL